MQEVFVQVKGRVERGGPQECNAESSQGPQEISNSSQEIACRLVLAQKCVHL